MKDKHKERFATGAAIIFMYGVAGLFIGTAITELGFTRTDAFLGYNVVLVGFFGLSYPIGYLVEQLSKESTHD